MHPQQAANYIANLPAFVTNDVKRADLATNWSRTVLIRLWGDYELISRNKFIGSEPTDTFPY